MTRNNLEVHLEWLLNQGPSLYPSLKPSARDNENDRTARSGILGQSASARTSVVTSFSVGIPQSTVEAGIEDIVGDNGTEVKSPFESDEDMARLLLAPPSASKPRMLSCQNNNASSRTPKTPNRRSVERSPAKPRSSQHRSIVKGTVVLSVLS